jgi:threonine dehydrogenase-like Zn-dependent dehydrogenase
MIDIEGAETAESEADLYPNPAILIVGAGAIGLISALSLLWPAASEFIVADPIGATCDVAARHFPQMGFVGEHLNIIWTGAAVSPVA